MSELKPVLESVRDRISQDARPGDPYQRFEKRVAATGRRRRTTAMAVAVALSIGSVALLIQAFGATSGRIAGAGAQFAPRVAASIPIGQGGHMRSLLATEDGVWVVHGSYGAPEVDSTLTRIDPHLGQIQSRIELNQIPTSGYDSVHRGMASGFGSIWIVGIAPGPDGEVQVVVDRIDPVSERVVASIPLEGRGGADVTVSGEFVWVSLTVGDRSEIVRIDPTTNSVVSSVELDGPYVVRMVGAENSVIALEEVPSSNPPQPCHFVVSISPFTGEVIARVPVSDPCGVGTLVAWRSSVWLVAGGFLSEIDPDTATISDGGLEFIDGKSPRSFVVADDTGVWYGAYPGGNGAGFDTLSRIDPATGEVEDYLPLSMGPFAAALLDGSLWTLNADGGARQILLERA